MREDRKVSVCVCVCCSVLQCHVLNSKTSCFPLFSRRAWTLGPPRGVGPYILNSFTNPYSMFFHVLYKVCRFKYYVCHTETDGRNKRGRPRLSWDVYKYLKEGKNILTSLDIAGASTLYRSTVLFLQEAKRTHVVEKENISERQSANIKTISVRTPDVYPTLGTPSIITIINRKNYAYISLENRLINIRRATLTLFKSTGVLETS